MNLNLFVIIYENLTQLKKKQIRKFLKLKIIFYQSYLRKRQYNSTYQNTNCAFLNKMIHLE